MLLIGKPGSGKTSLIKRLLRDSAMYKGKFDFVILLSPSAQKMGLSVAKERVSTTYNLDWIYEHLNTFNSM